MSYVADLHLHSSYAMATARGITIDGLSAAARRKGIDLIATGDFTHPAWRSHLGERLVDSGDGLFATRDDTAGPRFVLGTELSCVYPQDGRSHRIHLLVLAPDLGAVDRLSASLQRHGALGSDGRPVLRLSGRDVVELALDADERCEVIPAHIWTPWYAVLGSRGGFDSLQACFGDMTGHIHAVETGLSSDPGMNWRVPELDARTIVSFSDAHSPSKLGREATVFDGPLTYKGLRDALHAGRVVETLELPPEEGKYHYDGHRACGVSQHPAVSMETGGICPACGKPLTLGVLHRIESLASRLTSVEQAVDGSWQHPTGERPPYRWIVPLNEVVAAASGVKPSSKRVQDTCDALVRGLGSELHIALRASTEDIGNVAGQHIAAAIQRARSGSVSVTPGYDGVFGVVDIG